VDGCRIPTRAVVTWLLEHGPFEYWRGRITGIRDEMIATLGKIHALTYISAALAKIATVWRDGLAGALSERQSTISCSGGRPKHGHRSRLHTSP
jgi:hypothetical protein